MKFDRYLFINKVMHKVILFKKRTDYKDVWNKLALFSGQARVNISGNSDEFDFRKSAEETKKILLDTVGIQPNDYVLEIGCGVGRVGMEIAPLCKKWIGCDVSSNMLNFCKKRLQRFSNISLIELSGFDLQPIQSSTVDMVYCTVVFMHLEEWDRYNYILDAKRVLRPGGRIFFDNITVCTKEGWSIFEHHRNIPPHKRTPHISKSSTPQEFEAYLTNAGFENIKIQTSGAWVQAFANKPK